MMLNHYPQQYRDRGDLLMMQLLSLLEPVSCVLTPDMSDLRRWSGFNSLRVTLCEINGVRVAVCWWVVKALLLPPKPSAAELAAGEEQQVGLFRLSLVPTNPQTFCGADGFTASLPGVGLAQTGAMQKPVHFNKRHLRGSSKDRQRRAKQQRLR